MTTLLDAFFMCQAASYQALGGRYTADDIGNAASTGYIHDASEFSYSKRSSYDMEGLWVWRFNFDIDDANALRRVKSVDRTLFRLYVDGGVYSETSDLEYVLIGFDPREVLTAISSGYSGMPMRKETVLAPPESDWDNERSDEDYWDGTLDGVATTVTPLKEVATAANKVTGTYVLNILAGGAGGNQLSSRVRVVPGSIWTIAPCFRVASGTWTVQLYDDTAGAVFGDAYSYSGAEFCYLRFPDVTIPDGCDYIRVKFTTTDAAGQMYLDSIPARATVGGIFNLESWLTEDFRVPLIHRVRLQQLLKDSNVLFPAPFREYAGDFVLGTNYQVRTDSKAASPQVLDFEPDTITRLGHDIFYLQTWRDRVTVEPFDSLTDVTTAPDGELLAYSMVEVCSLLELKTSNPFWVKEGESWAMRKGAEVKPRAEVMYQPPHEVIRVKA